jgi:hypothetical protein
VSHSRSRWASMYARNSALMRDWYLLPWSLNHAKTSASTRRVTCYLRGMGFKTLSHDGAGKVLGRGFGDVGGVDDPSGHSVPAVSVVTAACRLVLVEDMPKSGYCKWQRYPPDDKSPRGSLRKE